MKEWIWTKVIKAIHLKNLSSLACVTSSFHGNCLPISLQYGCWNLAMQTFAADRGNSIDMRSIQYDIPWKKFALMACGEKH